MTFDLNTVKVNAGKVIGAASEEPVDRAKIFLALEEFDRTWFSLPVRRFRDAYARVVGLLGGHKTETPAWAIKKNHLEFEAYGTYLCDVALRQNYEREMDLIMAAGTLNSLADVLMSNQTEIDRAFARLTKH